ncbi:MAG: RNA polymerase subunit sigma [Bacteroidetes bacterium GWF2_49_14]|nr:MAG: RNA polymerase subunit sigma [Bacteroidetes bacterium GWF2_49_14]HBB93332.1 RNA polymerase subunit sigma [Bacteroidales bacterium]
MKETTNDAELISQFRDPNLREQAFRKILARYQEKLYWHVRRLVVNHDDTDDVLQNTMIKIWRGLTGFRESSELYTWMYRIASNEAITFLKARQKERNFIADDPEDALIGRMKSDPYFDGDEVFLKLQSVISELPPKQQLVFRMKYFDEMPYEEMALALKTSVGALKASYHHAVRKIQVAFTSTD